LSSKNRGEIRMLDKAKLLIEVNAILNSPFDPEKIIDLRDGIEHGTFDFKCPECNGSEINEMCDDPYYAEPCACTVDWRGEVLKNALEVRQLREENERLKEIDERECTIAISLKRERDELVKERNKMVKALETIAYKNMGGGEAGYASIILSEIKGQGDGTHD